jgi:hypothetical protein
LTYRRRSFSGPLLAAQHSLLGPTPQEEVSKLIPSELWTNQLHI